MRPKVVVEMLEGVDMFSDFGDVAGQVDNGVEFVAPSAVASVDAAAELRRSWRQDIEGNGLCRTRLLEFSHELGAAVIWMALTGQGISAVTLRRKPAALLAVALR